MNNTLNLNYSDVMMLIDAVSTIIDDVIYYQAAIFGLNDELSISLLANRKYTEP